VGDEEQGFWEECYHPSILEDLLDGRVIPDEDKTPEWCPRRVR